MALKYETVYSSLPAQSLMIESVKKPILESVGALFDKDASKIQKLRAVANVWKALKALTNYPKPTMENTWHPNCHNLIKLRDWVLEHAELGDARRWFIEHVFDLAIIIYDFDPPWRWIIDAVIGRALEMEWKPQGWGDDWSDGYHWWKR